MQYIWQHIADILAGFDGSLPLAIYLKNYFRKFPKLGSRDRRMLSDMAFCWFRAAKAISAESPTRDSIISSLRICRAEKTLKLLKEHQDTPVPECDINLLASEVLATSIGISRHEWLSAILQLPDLFIRVRKNKKLIEEKFAAAGVQYREAGEGCLALPNGSKIDQILPADAYVVQDASSQAAGRYFEPVKGQKWWDCCSGAGGKSIQLLDSEPAVELTVSDIRQSILHNHRQRCEVYGHRGIKYRVIDMRETNTIASRLGTEMFDRIICDVPCSGSGTFARSPEQLYFLKPQSQLSFPPLQAAIAGNAVSRLKKGGVLYYITCSVFSNENEEVVQQLIQQYGLTLKIMKLINGTGINADSLFIAELVKE